MKKITTLSDHRPNVESNRHSINVAFLYFGILFLRRAHKNILLRIDFGHTFVACPDYKLIFNFLVQYFMSTTIFTTELDFRKLFTFGAFGKTQ